MYFVGSFSIRAFLFRSVVLAYSRISTEYSSLFIIVINLIFMFSL